MSMAQGARPAILSDVTDVAGALACLAERVAHDVDTVRSGVRSGAGCQPRFRPSHITGELAEVTIVAAGREGLDPIHVEVTRPGDIDHACADWHCWPGLGSRCQQSHSLTASGAFLKYASSQGPVDPGQVGLGIQGVAAARRRQMKILLISPTFHGYWRSIGHGFISLGHSVECVVYDEIAGTVAKIRQQGPDGRSRALGRRPN